MQSDVNLPPALALMHDVDACIWQPELTNDFNMKHVGTLLALGYIQASKQQRKFTVSSPDFTYSVVCETSRHVFIYRQNKPILDSELRNRISSKRVGSVAQQQLISLENEEVLGIYAGNTMLFVLHENCISALKV